MSAPVSSAFQRTMPVLDVTDMDQSIAFYRDQLGFSANAWGDPPSFTIAQRGTVTLALNLNPKSKGSTNAWWSAYIYVEDVDAVHTEFVDRSIRIHRELEDTFYGCRDFDVQDPDGHILAFGTPHEIAPRDLGPGLGPDTSRDSTSPESAS